MPLDLRDVGRFRFPTLDSWFLNRLHGRDRIRPFWDDQLPVGDRRVDLPAELQGVGLAVPATQDPYLGQGRSRPHMEHVEDADVSWDMQNHGLVAQVEVARDHRTGVALALELDLRTPALFQASADRAAEDQAVMGSNPCRTNCLIARALYLTSAPGPYSLLAKCLGQPRDASTDV